VLQPLLFHKKFAAPGFALSSGFECNQLPPRLRLGGDQAPNAWGPDNDGIQIWSRVIGWWTVIGVFSKTERAGITSVDLSLHRSTPVTCHE
jgi:hypothetical protein